MIRIASLCAWLSGLGFGLPCLYGIWSMAQGRGIARVMGFPTYGEGIFERFGIGSTIPLLVAFLVICIAECIAGWMLWGNERGGAAFALALLPAELFFWIGFSLPFGPPVALARTLLIILSWSSLHHI